MDETNAVVIESKGSAKPAIYGAILLGKGLGNVIGFIQAKQAIGVSNPFNKFDTGPILLRPGQAGTPDHDEDDDDWKYRPKGKMGGQSDSTAVLNTIPISDKWTSGADGRRIKDRPIFTAGGVSVGRRNAILIRSR